MANSIDPRSARIIRGLWVRTVQRRDLAWETRRVRAGSERFDYSLPEMTVSIGLNLDGLVEIQFIDDYGIVIETLDEVTMSRTPELGGMLRELHETARRQALNIDGKIDYLDQALGLDDDPDIGK